MMAVTPPLYGDEATFATFAASPHAISLGGLCTPLLFMAQRHAPHHRSLPPAASACPHVSALAPRAAAPAVAPMLTTRGAVVTREVPEQSRMRARQVDVG